MSVIYSNQSIVAVVNSNTGTTAATTATLPAVAGKTTYLAGFTMSGAATTATSVSASITGLAAGTQTFLQPIGATTPVVLTMRFDPPLPASATNTTIAVISGAAGAAGLNSVTAWGFQQ